MFILSEYHLNPGFSESHTVWVHNDKDEARGHFDSLVKETTKTFPKLDVDENNAHWEDVNPDGPVVYDLILVETEGCFVK